MMDMMQILTKIASEGGVVTIMALILLAGVYAIVAKFMAFSKELAEQHQAVWRETQIQMHKLTEAINLNEERVRSELKALRKEVEQMRLGDLIRKERGQGG